MRSFIYPDHACDWYCIYKIYTLSPRSHLKCRWIWAIHGWFGMLIAFFAPSIYAVCPRSVIEEQDDRERPAMVRTERF